MGWPGWALRCLALASLPRPCTSDGSWSEIVCARGSQGSAASPSESLDLRNTSLDMSGVRNVTVAEAGLEAFLVGPATKGHPSCLDLSANRLAQWPRLGAFARNLRLLNLSANRLSSWEPAATMSLGQLLVLDLSENRLDHLDLSSLLYLTSLRVIYLFGNPIHIFSALKLLPSLKAVVLSVDYWYANNNIDFGRHPIEVLRNGTAEARRSAFRCSRRFLQGPSGSLEVGLGDCAQLRLSEAVVGPQGCLLCYRCQGANQAADPADRLRLGEPVELEVGEETHGFWVAVLPIALLAGLISTAVIFLHRRIRRGDSPFPSRHGPPGLRESPIQAIPSHPLARSPLADPEPVSLPDST